jgi:hypothetical protein
MAASCHAQRSTGEPDGKVPAGALSVRLRDGDVKAGEADRLAGVGETAHVAQLGPDRHGGQPTDPVASHERLAARLVARDTGQLGIEQVEFHLEVVDHPQGQVDRLAGQRRELGPGQPGPPVGGEQRGAVGQSMVEQDRVDGLVPAGVLADQPTAQPDPGAGGGDVGGWHPRLGQRARAQQIAQVAGVGAVGLGAPLGTTQRAGLGRLGQVPGDPGALQLLATNRQPVVASNAKSACGLSNCASQARRSKRAAGLSCPRRVSPVVVSIQS